MGYLLNNHPFDPTDFAAINRARTSGLRPICDCKPEGVPMYIAKIGEQFFLKRMPESGSKHAAFCEHYAPPPEVSGLGTLLGEAIIRHPSDNSTEIKVGFPLKKGMSVAREQTAPSNTGAVKASPKRVTMSALLDFIWEEAGLTHWAVHQRYERKYSHMREHILNAVNNKTIKGLNLKDILYIPEPYNNDDRNGIKRRRELVYSRIAGSSKYMMALGELKSIEPSMHGYKITLKHIPDSGFYIQAKTYLKLIERFEDIIDFCNATAKEKFDPTSPPEMKGIVLMTFSVNSTGIASVIEMTLHQMSHDLIPYDTFQEKMLMDLLKESGRTFERNLRYTNTSGRISRFTLLDCKKPTVLFITQGKPDEGMESDMRELRDKYDLDTWVWNTLQQDIPKLPEQHRVDNHYSRGHAQVD